MSSISRDNGAGTGRGASPHAPRHDPAAVPRNVHRTSVGTASSSSQSSASSYSQPAYGQSHARASGSRSWSSSSGSRSGNTSSDYSGDSIASDAVPMLDTDNGSSMMDTPFSSSRSYASYYPSARSDNSDQSQESDHTARIKLSCPYGFLPCTFHTLDFGEWDMHCRAHFAERRAGRAGEVKLPTQIECPFRNCQRRIEASTGREAWKRFRAHIGDTHRRHLVVDPSRHPSRYLVDYLWSLGVINNIQRISLIPTKPPDSHRVYLVKGGPVQELRQVRPSKSSNRQEWPEA